MMFSFGETKNDSREKSLTSITRCERICSLDYCDPLFLACVGSICGLLKMPQHSLSLRFGQYCAQSGRVSLLHGTNAAEVLQEPLARALADAGDFQQLGFAIAHLPALAMESDREAMRFVAHHLSQVQHGRVAVEHHRVVFLAED